MARKTTIQKRIPWIDVLRAFSCLGIVYLHINGIFWQRPAGWLWISANLIECLFYFSLPCFFMLTGYILMDYRTHYDTKTFLKKRLFRVVIPFFFWSAIFYKLNNNQDEFLYDLFNNWIISTYWFFPTLFACYGSIIFLSLIPNKIHNFLWLFAWGFIGISVLPFVRNAELMPFSTNWDCPMVTGYLLYILLGYILGSVTLSSKQRNIIYSLGLLGITLHFWGTLFSSTAQSVSTLFKNFLDFYSVFYAAAVFTWIKYHNWEFLYKNELLKLFIRKLNECCLGIYLIYSYLTTRILPILFSEEIRNTDVYRITMPLALTFLLCCAMTLLAKVIPAKWHFLLGYKEIPEQSF